MERKHIIGGVIAIAVLGAGYLFMRTPPKPPMPSADGSGSPCGDQASCKKACSGGDQNACTYLGGLLIGQDGGAPEALAMLTKGCNAGSANSCANLGTMYHRGIGVPENASKAV